MTTAAARHTIAHPQGRRAVGIAPPREWPWPSRICPRCGGGNGTASAPSRPRFEAFGGSSKHSFGLNDFAASPCLYTPSPEYRYRHFRRPPSLVAPAPYAKETKLLSFSHLGINARHSHRSKTPSRHSTRKIAIQQTGNHTSGTHCRPQKSDLPCQCYTYSPSLGP